LVLHETKLEIKTNILQIVIVYSIFYFPVSICITELVLVNVSVCMYLHQYPSKRKCVYVFTSVYTGTGMSL